MCQIRSSGPLIINRHLTDWKNVCAMLLNYTWLSMVNRAVY